MKRGSWQLSVGIGVVLAACGGSPTAVVPPPPPPPPAALDCSLATPLQLSLGEHQVIDPASSDGCLRVPAAGANGAEYVVVIASTAPNRSQNGVSGSYVIKAGNPGATSASAATPSFEVGDIITPAPTAQQRFHDMLRAREAELSRDRANFVVSPAQAANMAAPTPPVVGDVRTFKTCSNLTCTSFADVTATARYVGTKAAIYMDNTVPQNDTLQASDYADLGTTFDTYHYPIDNAAFGAESDVDGNERIVILMTDAVNALTPDCTNGRVLGYFFGLDLTLSGSQSANSNKAEIFYTFVPSPATAQCSAISRSQTLSAIKPTLIHEFQHMISWNQHVLVRGGSSEETWLNEALSHFAEELGGREIDNSQCPNFSSCRSQYVSSDIVNAYDYLETPESDFLVYPISSQGTLPERGASWYFLRWVVDHFAQDTIIGNDFTTRIVETPNTGAANLVAATGESFSRMVVEWQLANYLDDDSTITAQLSDRLRFKSWGLRSIWLDSRNAQIFPNGFPLKPDVVSGSYTHSGTLKAGSGRHLRLVQAANGPAIDVQVKKNTAGDALDPALAARIGIVRIH
jgi:hypothetical protein